MSLCKREWHEGMDVAASYFVQPFISPDEKEPYPYVRFACCVSHLPAAVDDVMKRGNVTAVKVRKD